VSAAEFKFILLKRAISSLQKTKKNIGPSEELFATPSEGQAVDLFFWLVILFGILASHFVSSSEKPQE